MTYAEQVAKEVAARYGIPASPEAVQIVPKGFSGSFGEYPVWNGRELVYPSQVGSQGRGMKASIDRRVNAVHRQKKFAKAAEQAYRAKPEPKQKAPSYIDLYSGRIRTMAAEGFNAQQIADDIRINVATCRSIARTCSISIPKAPRKKRGLLTSVIERRNLVAKMLDEGMHQADIIERLGIAAKTLRKDLDGLGVRVALRRFKEKPVKVTAPKEPRAPKVKKVRVKAEPKPSEYLARIAAAQDQVRKLHAKGLTNAQIGQKMNRAKTTIAGILKTIGLKANLSPDEGNGPKMAAAKERRLKAAALRKEGLTVAEIAFRMGCSKDAVTQLLSREGVHLTPRWQRAEIIAEVHRMHAAGSSAHVIARACRIGRSNVLKLIEKQKRAA